jgi:hypothetical protein
MLGQYYILYTMGIDIQVEILKIWETLELVLGKILAFQ